MRHYFLLYGLCFSLMCVQAQNPFWNKSYWGPHLTLDQVVTQVKKGADPVSLDSHGFDATTNAILAKTPMEIISYLLELKGNQVDKLTHDGRTYLFWAATSNRLPLVKLLVKKGAKISARDEKGYSVFLFAANRGSGNHEVLDFLLNNGASVKEVSPKGANALLLAALNAKSSSDLKYFVDKGCPLDSQDKEGRNLVDYAAQTGKQSLVEELIRLGLPYQDINKDGTNLVLVAAEGYRRQRIGVDFFKYLKSLGLDFNISDKNGANALHKLAFSNRDRSVFEFVLAQGVNPNALDHHQNNALLNAASFNTKEVITLLTEKTSDIQHQNREGKSALTNAVEKNSADVVAYLLEKGANPQVTDAQGRPLAYYLISSFSEKKSDDFYKKWNLLTQQGVDLGAAQHDGNTLFHWAVEKNNIDLLRKIATLPIDINQKNNDGLTALHKAVMSAKDLSLIQALLQLGASPKIATDAGETTYELAQENELLTHQDISFLK